MRRRVINTKLGLIEYSSVGEGTPILFIHGGHSNSEDKLTLKGLDKINFQLITPSRPGYGKTPLDNHKTPKDAADLFVALLDELHITEIIIYAVSAGGLTALELAAHYPDRVKKLLLVSAVTKKWLNKNEKTYRIAKVLFNPNIERVTWGMIHLFSKLASGFITKNFFPEFSMKTDAVITKDEKIELSGTLQKYRSNDGFVNDIDQNINVSILKKITCPTLILHSKYDASVSVDHAEHAHQEIKNSCKHILENKWGHMIWMGSDYTETLKLILEFINKKKQAPNQV